MQYTISQRRGPGLGNARRLRLGLLMVAAIADCFAADYDLVHIESKKEGVQ